MKNVLKIYTRLILFLLPFFFVPQIYNAFSLAKSGLLLVGGAIGLILWMIGMFVDKEETVKWKN